MAKTIDILTVIDPEGIKDNYKLGSIDLNSDIKALPYLYPEWLNKHVWMIAEAGVMVENQATWNLKVNADMGDTIRWWDCAIVQEVIGSEQHPLDILIINFNLPSNSRWKEYLADPKASELPVSGARIKDGTFFLGDNSKLKFMPSTITQHVIETKVIKAPEDSDVQINYDLVIAKLDCFEAQNPKVVALYRFDPTLIIKARH